MTKEKPSPNFNLTPLTIEEQKEIEELIGKLPYILKKLEDEIKTN